MGGLSVPMQLSHRDGTRGPAAPEMFNEEHALGALQLGDQVLLLV